MSPASSEKIGPILVGDRPLPQSLEAEKAVLSCLLLDPPATMDLVFSKIQTPDCFHSPSHRRLFSCLCEMRNNILPANIDLITVTSYLERSGGLDSVGGEEYLNQLINTVPTTANVEKYIDCVLDAHILRSLIRVCSEIVGECYEQGNDVHDLIDMAEQRIMNVTEISLDVHAKSVKDLMVGAINHLQDLSERKPETMGLSTGFDIDKKITGLKAGELIVLAARPSIGKTALAIDIARNIAVRSNPSAVGIFSMEMGSHQVVLRLVCNDAQINLKDVRDGRITPAQWQNKLMASADRLSAAPIFIDDTPQLSSGELRQKARRMKQDHDIKLIIIDYLQLMRPVGINKNTTREQEVSKLSADMKSLAKELNIPVLLLAQLNRQAEQGSRPKLSHLRESGAIEQDADIVMLLHREREMDLDRATDDETPEDEVESQIIVAKNRNGEIGIVTLRFHPEWTRFSNISYVDRADKEAHAQAAF